MGPFAGCRSPAAGRRDPRSEEHTSELQSQSNLVCRLLLEKKNKALSDSSMRLSLDFLFLFSLFRCTVHSHQVLFSCLTSVYLLEIRALLMHMIILLIPLLY